MSVETNAKFITELNEAYPRRNDLLKEGDDHMRLIKGVLKNTLPGFNRTVNISSEKLNHIDGMVDTTAETFTLKGNLTVADKKLINMGSNIVKGVSDPVDNTDAANKQFVQKEGVGFSWPVGSIYMTMDTRNPADIFGLGTWEKFATGRVIIGTGSDKDESGTAKIITLNTKGGNYNENISTENLPSHTHSGDGLQVTIAPGGEHSHKTQGSIYRNVRNGPDQAYMQWDGTHETYEGGSHTHTGTLSGTTGATGGNVAMNNMMPYIGVNIWRRTA